MGNSLIHSQLLKNYNQLIEKIDLWLNNIYQNIRHQMVCKEGCSDCCKDFTIYPVEALSIYSYLLDKKIITNNQINRDEMKKSKYNQIDKGRDHQFNKDKITQVNKYKLNQINSDSCLFLDKKGLCTIYPARPIICRTHGYPVALSDGSNQCSRVDYCRKNFIDINSKELKKEYLIDIENLNTILFSINSLFLKESKKVHYKLKDTKSNSTEIELPDWLYSPKISGNFIYNEQHNGQNDKQENVHRISLKQIALTLLLF